MRRPRHAALRRPVSARASRRARRLVGIRFVGIWITGVRLGIADLRVRLRVGEPNVQRRRMCSLVVGSPLLLSMARSVPASAAMLIEVR